MGERVLAALLCLCTIGPVESCYRVVCYVLVMLYSLLVMMFVTFCVARLVGCFAFCDNALLFCLAGSALLEVDGIMKSLLICHTHIWDAGIMSSAGKEIIITSGYSRQLQSRPEHICRTDAALFSCNKGCKLAAQCVGEETSSFTALKLCHGVHERAALWHWHTCTPAYQSIRLSVDAHKSSVIYKSANVVHHQPAAFGYTTES